MSRHIWYETLFQFGAAILMDPIWSVDMKVKATRRSRNFGKTLAFFLNHIAVNETEGHVSQEKRDRAEKTLLELVNVLAERDLAAWVASFLGEARVRDGGSPRDGGRNVKDHWFISWVI